MMVQNTPAGEFTYCCGGAASVDGLASPVLHPPPPRVRPCLFCALFSILFVPAQPKKTSRPKTLNESNNKWTPYTSAPLYTIVYVDYVLHTFTSYIDSYITTQNHRKSWNNILTINSQKLSPSLCEPHISPHEHGILANCRTTTHPPKIYCIGASFSQRPQYMLVLEDGYCIDQCGGVKSEQLRWRTCTHHHPYKNPL